MVRRGTICLCGSDRLHLIVGPARDDRCVVCHYPAARGCGRGIRSTTALCGCLLPGRRGGTAVLPAGKEPRNFGLHRVKQLAVVRQLTDIIQRPPNAVPRPTIRQTKA